MQFEYLGKCCTLQGILLGSLHVTTRTQICKCFFVRGQGPTLMVLTNSTQTTLTLPSQALHQDMKLLLVEFKDMFQLSKGLPPSRLQDHKTPLLDETQVV